MALAASLMLSGCSTDDQDPEPTVDPTDILPTETQPPVEGDPVLLTSIDDIFVDGVFGEDPDIDGPFPFYVEQTMSRVIIEGTGVPVEEEVAVELHYVGMNGRTGEIFDSSYASQQSMIAINGSFVEGFNKSLTGQKAGSRVLMVITSADAYDPDGNDQAGIMPGDTLLFVVDILKAQYVGPTGQHLADGNAWVTVTDSNGIPTAKVVPGKPAPTTLQTTVLTQGTGPAVLSTDVIYVNYFTMDYATGKYIENSYLTGVPEADLLANLIPGWRQALVGKAAGSRVLIIVPGSLAYPQGNATPAITPNATLVCIVDLLFAFQPSA